MRGRAQPLSDATRRNSLALYRSGVLTGTPHPELRVLIFVLGSPSTLRDQEDQGLSCGIPAPPSDGNLGAWAALVNGVVTRYGDQRFGTVGIEVWNEPNNPNFWSGGSPTRFDPEPKRFARLYNIAYPVIKAYDTDMTTPGTQSLLALPGGLSPLGLKSRSADTTTYMRDATDPATNDAASRIVATRVDALSVHLYANEAKGRRDARTRLATRWEEFRAGFRDNADNAELQFKSKDYWITEIGFPSRNGPAGRGVSTPNGQSARLMSAYATYGLKAIVKTLIVHRLYDQNDQADPDRLRLVENRDFGTAGPNDATTGLPPRPAYCALASQLGASLPAGCQSP